MKPADPIDAGRLTLALNDLRLPAIKTIWPDFAARADKEGWPAVRFLAALTEHELERIGLGAGPLSQWLHAGMSSADLGALRRGPAPVWRTGPSRLWRSGQALAQDAG
jgi:hypothetical protein